MTKEQAIRELLDCRVIYAPSLDAPENTLANRLVKAIDIAVESLERESCGDCISRVDAMRAITDEWVRGKHTLEGFTAVLYNLPPVIPEPPVMTGEWVTTRTQAESEENG